jgi:hypothetical protein
MSEADRRTNHQVVRPTQKYGQAIQIYGSPAANSRGEGLSLYGTELVMSGTAR